MSLVKRPCLVWALLIGLVLMNGLMAAPSVAHAEHHGAHKAGTHATGICAWFCAAGQEIEAASVNFSSALQLVGSPENASADPVLLLPSIGRFSRGPPAPSL